MRSELLKDLYHCDFCECYRSRVTHIYNCSCCEQEVESCSSCIPSDWPSWKKTCGSKQCRDIIELLPLEYLNGGL